jgi:hypothetical protein
MFLFAVTHLSGQARLHFTRHPYTHWSFSFFGDPVLDLQVESQFQGRPLPQITSVIVSQVVFSFNTFTEAGHVSHTGQSEDLLYCTKSKNFNYVVIYVDMLKVYIVVKKNELIKLN